MKKTPLILIGIFIVAYLLRVMYLPKNALTFGYDQARDAIQAQNIISGDFKILGPPASTPGLHHGVFWFYFLVPPNLVSGGDPVASAYWNALFNAGAIFVIYKIASLMAKDKKTGLLAAFLLAISFEATQYATWLSNPTTAAWSVPLMYLGLWLWVGERDKKDRLLKYAPIIAGLGLGLSIQANVFLLYHSIPVLLWLWVVRKKVTRYQAVTGLATLLMVVSTMIVSEIKFGFKSISGVVSLLSSGDSIVASKQLGDFILLFFNQLGRVFAFNSYPGNVGYAGVFVLVLAFLAFKSWQGKKSETVIWQPFLLTWLFAHLTVVSVGGTSTPFLLVGIGPAVSILIAVFLVEWWEKGSRSLAILVFGVIVFGNLNMIVKENPKGQTIFAIQKDMLLSKQLQAIDWTYERSGGEEFGINTLTSPLWINIVWSYLYKWHGQGTYGYTPSFHGKDQVGQLLALPYSKETSKRFLIIEPMGGIPLRYLGEAIAEEDGTSIVASENNWGELRVQERVRIE